jgi:hypothetical protein
MAAKPAGPASMAEQIAAVPVRNHTVRVEEQPGGTAALATVPLVYGPVLRPLAAVMKLRREKTFRLDDLGYALYRRIDGMRTVENLADELAQDQSLSFHEARVLVMRYLQILMVRGLVVLAKPVAGKPAAD